MCSFVHFFLCVFAVAHGAEFMYIGDQIHGDGDVAEETVFEIESVYAALSRGVLEPQKCAMYYFIGDGADDDIEVGAITPDIVQALGGVVGAMARRMRANIVAPGLQIIRRGAAAGVGAARGRAPAFLDGLQMMSVTVGCLAGLAVTAAKWRNSPRRVAILFYMPEMSVGMQLVMTSPYNMLLLATAALAARVAPPLSPASASLRHPTTPGALQRVQSLHDIGRSRTREDLERQHHRKFQPAELEFLRNLDCMPDEVAEKFAEEFGGLQNDPKVIVATWRRVCQS